MAITATQAGSLPYYTRGAKKVSYTDITLGEVDYASWRIAVTAADLRLSSVEHAEAQITVASNGDGALLGAEWDDNDDGTGGNIVLYDNAAAEPTDDDDVSATVVRVIATGY